MRVASVFWNVYEWAAAVVELATGSPPLAARTVVVPNEGVAHALRRVLVGDAAGARALVGTRFLTLAAAARTVLEATGETVEDDPAGLAGARVARVLGGGSSPGSQLSLEYFDRKLLRGVPGWDEAFAETIAALERAGLDPDDLARAPDAPPRWRDLATVWRDVEALSPAESPARWLARAATLLAQTPTLGASLAPALVTFVRAPSAVEARFAAALPDSRIAVLGARPVRSRFLERVEAVGDELRGVVARSAPPPPPPRATDLGLVAAYLFADPGELPAERQRNEQPDGTVLMEEHSGAEAELEAAADWVAAQVLERRRPLGDIAVLTPRADATAALLAARLARLPWQDGPLPVRLAGGRLLADTEPGVRALALVRALQEHLSLASLARILALLRRDGASRAPLGPGESVELANALGCAGGHVANPRGALDWPGRVARHLTAFEATLATAAVTASDSAVPGAGSAGNGAHDHDTARALERLRSVAAPIEELVAVARLVLDGARLSTLLEALADFAEARLLQPGGAPVQAMLRHAAREAGACPGDVEPTGRAALDWTEALLLGARFAPDRLGEPAVYVGTVSSAVGLTFGAVRIVGLAEGTLPALPREDPVLPSADRARLSPALDVPEDRPAAELQSLHRVVRGVRDELVLSAPHTDLDGVQREPSGVFVEVASALGRRWTRTAGASTAAFRHRSPLTASAWLERIATPASVREIPRAWLGSGPLALERTRQLHAAATWHPGRSSPAPALDGELAPIFGVFHEPGPFPLLPGPSPDRPISASRLGTLLGCPRRFLFEHVLYRKEAPVVGDLRTVDALSFGSLLHAAAETFYAEHGAEFVAGQGRLETWLERAREVADAAFADFLDGFPLLGATAPGKARQRLREAVQHLLEHDWSEREGRAFVGVERAFGYDAPVNLGTSAAPLFVRGRIDRLDVERGKTLVRDLKTGKAKPRRGDQEGPVPTIDVQLAVYGRTVATLANGWKLPRRIEVAYLYVEQTVEVERAFRDDYAELDTAAAHWFEVVHDLLTARCLPPTAAGDHCGFCPYQVVCGPHRSEHGALVAAAEPTAGALSNIEELG